MYDVEHEVSKARPKWCPSTKYEQGNVVSQSQFLPADAEVSNSVFLQLQGDATGYIRGVGEGDGCHHCTL